MTAQCDGYTINQTAKLLSVSRRTIYYWIEEGRIIPVKTITRQLIPHEEVVKLRLTIT